MKARKEDDGGWLQPAAIITKNEIALAAETYRMLDTSGSGLKLAGRRFGSAALRERTTIRLWTSASRWRQHSETSSAAR